MRLEAERLTVTPPGAAEPAVVDRSLAVRPGEWLGLAGANGSGKTSLLLGLAGLWPSTGALRLDGVPFGYGSAPEARRRLAVIQQDPSSQILQATVFDELAFAPRNLGAADVQVRERVAWIAGRLGLSGELGRNPGTLSAGRQQMVLLGAALAASPAVLVADEATAHMDAASRMLALGALEEESARGLALVWATQSAEELRAMDRALELSPAPVATVGSPPPRAADPGPPLVVVHVTPAIPSEEGPLVRTDRPLALEIGRRGPSAIMGPNGAGKSVILAAIAGLAPAAQVTVEWRGDRSPPPIAALQFPELQIFQELVSDEIAYASVRRGLPAVEILAAASKWLERLEFAPQEFLRRRTWTLPLGAKRLTEVIGAALAPASVILLDEPTAGLDAARRARLGELLSELAIERPIVVATQDREWARSWGFRITEIGPTD